jgi:glucose/arabinose dehydrogenase
MRSPICFLFLAATSLAACGDDTATAEDAASTGYGIPATAATSVTASSGSTASTASGDGGGAASGSSTGGGAGDPGAGGGGGDGTWTLAFEPLALPDELNLVTEMKFLPGAPDELLALEKGGRVSHLRIDGDEVTRLGEFLVDAHDDLDCGLISLAFAPDFAETGDLYLGFCVSGYASRVARFRFDTSDYDAIADSAEEILFLEEPDASRPWHNVGAMGFDPDGVLWVLAGDKTVSANAPDRASDLGKLLRVIPHEGSAGCDPAPDNPFVGDEDASPNVYALGLRSPWRGARDRFNRFWIGDVGLDSFEEVNVVLAPGDDFGWPESEGPCEEGAASCVEPVTYYGRGSSDPYVQDDPEAFPAGTRAVWVGPYLDPVDDDPYGGVLDDHLLFGDLHTGFVRMLHIGEGREVLADFPVAHLAHGMAWDRGPGGYLYVLTFGTLLGSDTTTSELHRVLVE